MLNILTNLRIVQFLTVTCFFKLSISMPDVKVPSERILFFLYSAVLNFTRHLTFIPNSYRQCFKNVTRGRNGDNAMVKNTNSR